MMPHGISLLLGRLCRGGCLIGDVMKIIEEELAKKVIEYFDGTGYEIYQEVETHRGIVDIVLKYSNFIWAIEVKTSLSMSLIEQAYMNKILFNYSSIAYPKAIGRGGGTSKKFVFDILKNYGIGAIEIPIKKPPKEYNKLDVKRYKDFLSIKYFEAEEILKAKFYRKAMIKHVHLYDEQKNFAKAGNSNGKRFTAFQSTKLALIDYVEENPNCKLKDALMKIGHHYSSISSATNSIRTWINKGVIKEVVLNNGVLSLVSNNK